MTARRDIAKGVLGTYERLYLNPGAHTLHLLISAPIDLHARVIAAFGPGAWIVRETAAEPEPDCTVAVLPTRRPVYPATDQMALAEACLACLETLQASGHLAGMAPQLEERCEGLAAAARTDRPTAPARPSDAQ